VIADVIYKSLAAFDSERSRLPDETGDVVDQIFFRAVGGHQSNARIM
jgi:hypothetical protein